MAAESSGYESHTHTRLAVSCCSPVWKYESFIAPEGKSFFPPSGEAGARWRPPFPCLMGALPSKHPLFVLTARSCLADAASGPCLRDACLGGGGRGGGGRATPQAQASPRLNFYSRSFGCRCQASTRSPSASMQAMSASGIQGWGCQGESSEHQWQGLTPQKGEGLPASGRSKERGKD